MSQKLVSYSVYYLLLLYVPLLFKQAIVKLIFQMHEYGSFQMIPHCSCIHQYCTDILVEWWEYFLVIQQNLNFEFSVGLRV